MLGADVLTLGMAADDRRREARGTSVVTYLRVFDLGGGDFSRAELAIPNTAAEVRLYGLPTGFDDAVAQVRALKTAAAGRRVAAFSYADLVERGWSEASRLRALVEAGLDDVAELPADLVTDLNAAVAALTAAGAAPTRVTIAQPVGDDRVELLRRVQHAFDMHACLRRFAPLPRVAPVDKPTTGYDDVRMVAVARLALPGRSIEVDWQLYGPKLAQVALTFGADHLDAVSAVDDASLGRRRTAVEDIERNIRAAGFEPQEYRP
jgi:aminodeoxyfutalosine synthase